jgi:hypothetical protein
MQDVFSTLSGIVGEFAAEPEAKEPIVFAAWRRTSGNLISENAKPLNFENATLKIAVRDKNWQRQLADHAREYLFRINSMLEGISVDRVEFVIQPTAFEQTEIGSEKSEYLTNPPSPDILASANSIADSSLREQFLRAAAASESRAGKN